MFATWTPRTGAEREAHRRFPAWRVERLWSVAGRRRGGPRALLVPTMDDGTEVPAERRWVPLDQITAGGMAPRVTT